MTTNIEKYIVVAHMPACSAVLFVNPTLEDPYKITILTEDAPDYCVAYAAGFTAGSGLGRVRHRGALQLPSGNPAQSLEDWMGSHE